MFADSDSQVTPVKVTLVEEAGDIGVPKTYHESLLKYLTSRLDQGNRDRTNRVTRYANIDRLISTWQALTEDDAKRLEREKKTGVMEAVTFNLPLLATHLEDTVAFFAEIYSPTGRDFYSTAPNRTGKAAKMLAEKMNQDTRARAYYLQLTLVLRSLIKYNIGGFHIRWEEGNGVAGTAEAGNRHESIDMYNFLWDPSILDISKLATEGEWSAIVHKKSRVWLLRNALNGVFTNLKDYLAELDSKNLPEPIEVKYYKNPPTATGLSADGQDSTAKASINWSGYFEGIGSTSRLDVGAHELTEMYCWVNPVTHGLKKRNDKEAEQLELWKFMILDAKHIIRATQVTAPNGLKPVIPHLMSYMTVDDMREAQRSIMEMMRGFQRFGSFLMNIYVNGARKNIWGTKIVDPSGVDTTGLDQGQVAGVLKSKVPGRDVRTIMADTTTSTGVDESFQMLQQLLSLVQLFYPNQAQPAQIAGIERAVKNQVAAVLQGSNRRLHMLVKVIDASLMMPARVLSYRNLVENKALGEEKLEEQEVATVLGSGLMSIDADRWAEALKELIFALFQNPDSMVQFDLAGMLTHWSRLQNSSTDLGDFYKPQQAPTPGTPGAPGQEPAPGAEQQLPIPGV